MHLVLKWRKAAILALLLMIAAQATASILVRLGAVHDYLQAALERAFGRPVEVRHFNVALLPRPALDADEITVAEDPEFGNEYFLRAERLSASLRWRGLLRGHFEFGTLSLSHASLILVRNREGSWNMERWLPPATSNLGLGYRFYGPQKQRSPSNHLQQIEVSDGRVDFKLLDEKAPFAFIGVSGKVNQTGAGRWHLELEAQPWSSGEPIQSAGTILVRGDVAGTSARLQPAELQVHWEKASLADLFRLLRGQDYGIRGMFTLDATVRSDAASLSPTYRSGDWKFSVQARAAQIHRWDLSEQSDDPAVNLHFQGRWNTISRSAIAERFTLETARSNLQGSARYDSLGGPSWEVRVESAGVQATDLLAWYRAFDADVNKVVQAEAFLTGGFTLRGWPINLQDAAFSTTGGELRIAGSKSIVRIGPFQGGRNRDTLSAGPVRVSYEVGKSDETKGPNDHPGELDIAFRHDLNKHIGALTLDGHLEKTEKALKLLAAIGKPMNRGWDLVGPSDLALSYRWEQEKPAAWNGHVDFAGDALHVVGINGPLDIHKARLEFNENQRLLRINSVDAFGTSWSGQATQSNVGANSSPGNWNVQFHTDRLDAAELNRWVNPKARSGWLERFLPSLLSSNNPTSGEPLRRLNADGELHIDEFVLDKVRLNQFRAIAGLHDLHLDLKRTDARWAAGKLRLKLRASFLEHPSYEANVDLDDIDLKQLPWADNLSARFAGRASATLHLNLEGNAREELLQSLTGKGEVIIKDLEFEGWDANAILAGGEPHEGASHWTSAEGVFQVRGGSVTFPSLRLASGPDLSVLRGTFAIAKDSNFSIEPAMDDQIGANSASAGYVLKVSGPVDVPKVSIERLVARRRVE